MKLVAQHYLINGVLNEAIEQVAASADEKSVEIKNEVQKEIAVDCDFDIVTRVLVNLLTNAIKFTPSGGKITLNAKEAADDPKMAVIEVADTGEGIPKEKMAKIFERFSQAEARDLGSTSSTGLGLTFCKLAVEAHGGTIGVDSEKGKGSTFYISLSLGDPAKVVVQESLAQDENTEDLDLKNEQITQNNDAEEIQLEFSTQDKEYFVPYIEQFDKLSVFHTSEINDLLAQMTNEEVNSLSHWKEEMESAMYNCNEKRWMELLDIVK